MLTAETRIRIKGTLPAPAKRPPLTGDTRIRLSQIKDLRGWIEDKRTYKPGEISEKTGLQKQPDGSWKEPKKNRILHSAAKNEKTSTEIEHKLTEEQKAQTKEIETRINKSGWFKKPSTLDGMHPKAAGNIEKHCEALFKQFPEMKGFVEGLKLNPNLDEKTFAMCEATGPSAFIVFNKNYYSDDAKLNKTYDDTVRDNYHPKGTKADSLIVHEMAHCLCDYLAQKKGVDFDTFCRDIVRRTKDTYRKNKEDYNVIKELGIYSTDIQACPIEEIQNAELIADAYAEYKCSKTPRKFACIVGQLLEGEYK